MSDSVDPSSLRDRYELLVEWSIRAYAEGKSVHEVMCAVYGVDLPQEAYAFHRAMFRNEDIQIEWFQEPWVLIRLASPNITPTPASTWSVEQITNALAQEPNFLPLLQLGIGRAKLDDHVIGYDLSQLRQGKTTILGHQDEIPSEGASFEIVGDSLLSVLQQWISERLKLAAAQYRSPSNRGAGSISHDNVEEVSNLLKDIEKLQRKVAEKPSTST
jgi:hypothetical protein